MKCPKCGFENRPDARFCKQCGQPLQAPAAPPPAELPCPRCGAMNKPGARFCARCGAPLAPPAPSPAPPAAPPPTPPAAPPPAYGPPVPPPPIPAAQPPYGPPPSPTVPPPSVPSPEPEPARRVPRWLWVVLPTALVLCLVVVGVLGYSAYRRGKLPFLRPSPTPTAAPTATPTPEMTGTPSPSPAPEPALAQVEVVPSASELKVGEPLTLTVTVINTGDRPWTQTEYRLLGGWEPMLEPAGSPEPSSEELLPGASRPVTFTLTARQEGAATLKVLLLLRTGGDRPEWEAVISKEVSVRVGP